MIAFGGISTVSTSQTPTSVSVSGSDTIGVVYVNGDAGGDNITAVDWGGTAMTKVAAVFIPSARWTSTWIVVNPPAGANTITFTGGSFWRSVSFFYTGAKQSGQPDSSNTNTSTSSTSISVSTTVVAPDSWLVMCQSDGAGGNTYSASNDISTMRFNTDAGGLAVADSNGTVATGSRTATLTGSSSTGHAGTAFSIAPVETSTNSARRLLFMGM